MNHIAPSSIEPAVREAVVLLNYYDGRSGTILGAVNTREQRERTTGSVM